MPYVISLSIENRSLSEWFKQRKPAGMAGG